MEGKRGEGRERGRKGMGQEEEKKEEQEKGKDKGKNLVGMGRRGEEEGDEEKKGEREERGGRTSLWGLEHIDLICIYIILLSENMKDGELNVGVHL